MHKAQSLRNRNKHGHVTVAQSVGQQLNTQPTVDRLHPTCAHTHPITHQHGRPWRYPLPVQLRDLAQEALVHVLDEAGQAWARHELVGCRGIHEVVVQCAHIVRRGVITPLCLPAVLCAPVAAVPLWQQLALSCLCTAHVGALHARLRQSSSTAHATPLPPTRRRHTAPNNMPR